MKPEEALKNIGDWISDETRQRKYDKATVIELSDSLITLKVAVNKQVPKKPIESEFTPLICPDCEAKVILGQKYCDNCGQRIDWGYEE